MPAIAGRSSRRRHAPCSPPRPASSTPAASASSPTPRADRPAPSSPPPSAAWRASSTAARWPPTPAPPTARACSFPSHPPSSARGTAWPCCSCGATTPAPRSRPRRRPRASRSSTGASPRSTRRRSATCARATAPRIVHAVLSAGEVAPTPRPSGGRCACAGASRRRPSGTYVASCSFRTIVYKGLVPADALADFYLDLADERFAAAVRHLPPALLHQHAADVGARPAVPHAVPQRRDQRPLGQRATACGAGPSSAPRPSASAPRSCSARCSTPTTPTRASSTPPSSCSMRGGRDLRHAMAMLVPEAWENVRDLDPEVRGFYRYHSALMEPWDGPAGLVFTDGIGVGARLDRNGLRPLRYAGVRGRLRRRAAPRSAPSTSAATARSSGAGSARARCCSSTPRGASSTTHACKERIAAGAPYAQWAADGFYRLGAGRGGRSRVPDDLVPARRCTGSPGRAGHGAQAHGHRRPRAHVLDGRRLAAAPTWRRRARPVSHYLRQRFAQVTNPPIDPLRERLVMSLRTVLGPRQPLLTESAEARRAAHARLVLPLPVGRSTPSSSPTRPRGRSSRSTPPSRSPTARRACGPRSTAWPTRPSAAVEGGAGIARPRRRRPPARPGPGPVAARDRGGPPARSPTRRLRSRTGARRRGRRRVRRARRSPRCSATAPTPSAPASPWRPSPPRPTPPTTATSPAPRRRAASRRRSRPACSRSCPRWASPPSTPTAAPRSSRCSASAPRSSTCASPARPTSWAASAGTALGEDVLGPPRRRPGATTRSTSSRPASTGSARAASPTARTRTRPRPSTT